MFELCLINFVYQKGQLLFLPDFLDLPGILIESQRMHPEVLVSVFQIKRSVKIKPFFLNLNNIKELAERIILLDPI